MDFEPHCPFTYFMSCQQQFRVVFHGKLTRPLGKFVKYEINDLSMYRPGFYVPDISDSSRTAHKFDLFSTMYTYRQPVDQWDGQIKY